MACAVLCFLSSAKEEFLKAFARFIAEEKQPFSFYVKEVNSVPHEDKVKKTYHIIEIEKQLSENFSTIMEEILCSDSISILEKELKTRLELRPNELNYMFEFLIALFATNKAEEENNNEKDKA